MALFKYLRREGPVCECGALSKETEQVHECVRPLEPNSKNAVRQSPLYWPFLARS